MAPVKGSAQQGSSSLHFLGDMTEGNERSNFNRERPLRLHTERRQFDSNFSAFFPNPLKILPLFFLLSLCFLANCPAGPEQWSLKSSMSQRRLGTITRTLSQVRFQWHVSPFNIH